MHTGGEKKGKPQKSSVTKNRKKKVKQKDVLLVLLKTSLAITSGEAFVKNDFENRASSRKIIFN